MTIEELAALILEQTRERIASKYSQWQAGLSAPACDNCRRLNPHPVIEAPPLNCHACGAPMRAPGETDSDFAARTDEWRFGPQDSCLDA